MTDGIHDGLTDALWLVGYLIGLAPLYAAAAIVCALIALAIVIDPRHRIRVWRLHRQTRRSGRTIDGPPHNAVFAGIHHKSQAP